MVKPTRVTNDIRASKVWKLGGHDLTTTVGFYSSQQTIDSDWNWSTVINSVAADGNAALLNVVTSTGVFVTQDGTLRYGAPTRPVLAGAAAGLLAGGLAATFYAAHCFDDSPLFVAVWYTIAIAVLTILGAIAGRLFIRW